MLIHDGAELDFTGPHSIATLGFIGNGHGRGYLCHNSLAVEPQRREVLGLVSQILHHRVSKGKKAVGQTRRASRESRLWSRAVEDLPAAPAVSSTSTSPTAVRTCSSSSTTNSTWPPLSGAVDP